MLGSPRRWLNCCQGHLDCHVESINMFTSDLFHLRSSLTAHCRRRRRHCWRRWVSYGGELRDYDRCWTTTISLSNLSFIFPILFNCVTTHGQSWRPLGQWLHIARVTRQCKLYLFLCVLWPIWLRPTDLNESALFVVDPGCFCFT